MCLLEKHRVNRIVSRKQFFVLFVDIENWLVVPFGNGNKSLSRNQMPESLSRHRAQNRVRQISRIVLEQAQRLLAASFLLFPWPLRSRLRKFGSTKSRLQRIIVFPIDRCLLVVRSDFALREIGSRRRSFDRLFQHSIR